MSAPTPFPEPSQDPYYQPPPYQQSQPMGGGATLSGWWPRVGAQILDWLIALGIVGIPAIILIVVLYVTLDEDTASSITSIIFYPLWFGWLFLYYPLTMKRGGNRNGQTWGMQVVGIRVVREDGYRFSGGNAIVREVLVKNFLMGLCFIVQILNYLWPLWDDKNQCLHDKICNTLVLRA
jgi:uncharacterized RDD family membrane protein YckC